MDITELLAILDLDQVEDNLFVAHHPRGRESRLYGGQIMAQAVMAAARTVSGARPVHSLHGYFLKPGDPKIPAVIQVDRVRDGASFSNRGVRVIQRGAAIFVMDLSFQVSEGGLTHELPMPELAPPQPDRIPDYLYDAPILSWQFDFKRLHGNEPQPPYQYVWFKSNGAVPNDPILQTCLLVYESDNTLISTARLPHRGRFDRARMQVASLDHAMWIHGPVDLNEWHLYAQDCPSTSGSRGVARGAVYTAGGKLVASTVQEGLIRVR